MLQGKINCADAIMASCMLQADQAISPSNQARSHSWSPSLVQAQKKKGLTTNLLSLVNANQHISTILNDASDVMLLLLCPHLHYTTYS
mmetsp:Transcript_26756/g.41509  ORF Transcript_26756/g.41509 Transcript_26756/m.41509 type:complete len:88 (+) Transcript_26756:151-414(+)